MDSLLNLLLFLVWVAVYLGAAYGIGRYWRARACPLGAAARTGFRVEKDAGFRFVVFALGIFLAAAVYLFMRAFL